MGMEDQDWERMEERYPVETSVGTLVWVRRRNGHWWPGQVVAAHEVPRSHLLVPKSGHPVKLLGKDDASVDWYNLCKSRRIKAFRCGEFDDCIERARSFGSLRSKNREKYARRDDAILHALELEKMQAEGCQRLERLFSVGTVTGLPGLPRYMQTKDGHGSKYQDALVDCGVASDDTMGPFLFPQSTGVFKSSSLPYKRESSTSWEWENGTTEAVPRMRDLQDIGFTNSKGNKPKYRDILEAPSPEVGTGTFKGPKISCKTVPEAVTVKEGNHNFLESCITRITPGACSAPSVTKAASVTIHKRKKGPDGSSVDESSHKKRHRRRPLTQVMKNSSTRKLACSGGASSAVPFSSVNCQMRMYCGDRTEAMSSQEPFQQAANEFRPCSEPRDFDLLQGVHQSSYGMKQEECKPLADTDRSLSGFWQNSWDSSRWPSLVSSQMDFGLLLCSGYADSAYEGTKPTIRFPGMACTGSATSVNTPSFEKSDSWKYLHQGDIGLSKPVGHNKSRIQNKGIDSDKKQICKSDSPVCVSGGQAMSKWQVKRRRDARKSLHCLRAEKLEHVGYNRSGGLVQVSELNMEHTRTSTCIGTTYIVPLSQQGRARPWVSSSDPPSHNSGRSGVCCVRRVPESANSRQGGGWVDVRVQFYEPKRNTGATQLVSLYSEVLNRAVSGHPVSVQVWVKPVKYDTVTTSPWSRSKLDVSSGRNIPRCPVRAAPNRRCVNNMAAQNGEQRSRRCKFPRRSGSTSQKTRMLSSFAGDEARVRPEPGPRRGSEGVFPSDTSKGPVVTCIPVHVVFQRIREVLYKRPEENESLAGNPEQQQQKLSHHIPVRN